MVGVRCDEPRFERVGEGGEFLYGSTGFRGLVGFGFDAGGVPWGVLVECDDVDACVEEVVGLQCWFAVGVVESPRVVVPDDARDIVFRGECSGDVVNAFPVDGFLTRCFFAVPVVSDVFHSESLAFVCRDRVNDAVGFIVGLEPLGVDEFRFVDVEFRAIGVEAEWPHALRERGVAELAFHGEADAGEEHDFVAGKCRQGGRVDAWFDGVCRDGSWCCDGDLLCALAYGFVSGELRWSVFL